MLNRDLNGSIIGLSCINTKYDTRIRGCNPVVTAIVASTPGINVRTHIPIGEESGSKSKRRHVYSSQSFECSRT